MGSRDGQVELRATGQVVLFDGFLKVYEEGRDEPVEDDDKRLPQLTAGEPARFDTGALKPAFAKAMGEFGATITFVSNIPGETRTVPSAIYAFLQVPGGEDTAFRLVVLSIAIGV